MASKSEIDQVLTAQFAVAWAGEGGEAPRLGWWRTDLVSEFGGKDLFQRLLPHTWEWAVLQGAREAARRHDASLRAKDHSPDSLVSLYGLGFEFDEKAEERLQDLKRGGTSPSDALPGLNDVLVAEWDVNRFEDWVAGHGTVTHSTKPLGRLVKGPLPSTPFDTVRRLIAALTPLSSEYPIPHYRQSA
jgi:hypothetical protein